MSWSIDRIQEEFGASNYMARRAKQLVREHGILATPDPRPGRPNLSESVVDQVTSFYENDSSSRMMPGEKKRERKTMYPSSLTMGECTSKNV